MGWIEIKKWFREFGGISLVWRTKQISKKEKPGAYEKKGISQCNGSDSIEFWIDQPLRGDIRKKQMIWRHCPN